MDERRFEAMIRFLHAVRTRRGAFREVLAGLAALLFLADPPVADARNRRRRHRRKRHKRRQCRDGTTRCGGVCVDTETDPNNCGRCGRACAAGETCRAGNCACDVCDGDDCPFQSIQAAVNAAQPGAAIAICEGTYRENLILDKSVTLIGAGSEETIVKPVAEGSVVIVEAGVAVTLRGIGITDGRGPLDVTISRGGGILNHGTLTLAGCDVYGNQATDGAGIFNDGALTLDGTRVGGNTGRSARLVRSGGGIYNDRGGTLDVRNGSAIEENVTSQAGGILNRGTATVREGSAIRENGASFDGGGIINSDGSLTLDGAVIEKNETNGWGGGLFNFRGVVLLRNNTRIGKNLARQLGGGVYNESSATLQCEAAAIEENVANDDGGGIFNNGGLVTNETGRLVVRANKPNDCVGTTVCLT